MTGDRARAAVFAATLFCSAALLFMLQPLYGRMLLPRLGGSPAVWNTAMVFFQAALLAGYLYAHLLAPRLGLRAQALLHLAILASSAIFLPIAVPDLGPAGDAPIGWLFLALAGGVGLPFVAVAASAPLLQSWFSRSGHPDAGDPYFLYAASNLGSLVGLLGYPLLVEPRLRVADQGVAWAIGFAVLFACIAACARMAWAFPPSASRAREAPPLGWPLRIRWIALSAVPSTLLLGVTTHITTDIAAVPLLWVVPLALYLLTFVVAFGRQRWSAAAIGKPAAALTIMLVLAFWATAPVTLVPVLHLAAFFAITLVLHTELVRVRPDAAHLTEFYLWMSFGGVVGGAVPTLLAPLVFDRVVEYPIALVLACFLRPGAPLDRAGVVRDLAIGGAVALVPLGIRLLGVDPVTMNIAAKLAFFVPLALVLYAFAEDRPIRFGLAVAGVMAGWVFWPVLEGRVLHRDRSFFGSYVVTDAPDGFRVLQHGITVHGAQLPTDDGRRIPRTYYAVPGPLGQLFASIADDPPKTVGVVGLGAGAAACYRTPGQAWTFYEIDPIVEEIARDPRFFTFLADCTPDARVVIGDARISLVDEPDGAFDLLILDAFSSDAIPMHLMTAEAFALYARKLSPDGRLMLHVSNRNLDLAPVVGNLLADAGFRGWIQDFDPTDADVRQMAYSSRWVAASRTAVVTDPRWRPLAADPAGPRWSDDFSDILSALSVRGE